MTNLCSQFAHGTYLFVLVTDDFAAAAIDSRENVGAQPRDGICKISILDPFTICLHQGIARGDGFESSAIARSTFAAQTKPADLQKLASSWADEMGRHIETLCITDPSIVENMKPNAASAIFLSHDGTGPVRGCQAKIQEKNRMISKLIDFIPCGTCAYTSYPEIVEEVLAYTSPRAKALYGTLKPTGVAATDWAIKAKMCVRAVIEWTGDREVGGEISAIVLERGKQYRWVNRPDFVPQG
jgi:hypothetical protein